MEIISVGRFLTHTSSIEEKITWIKNWVTVGGDTPFNDIRMLQGDASHQNDKDSRLPNVLWGNHNGKEVLTVGGLTVPSSGWGMLYTKLIRRIKADLKLVTFSAPLDLPHQADLIEDIANTSPFSNFATTLPATFKVDCKRYLLSHVLKTDELRARFLLPHSCSNRQWNEVAAREWMSQCDRLIRSLCVLGYLSGGPGSRGEEWASLLGMNEPNGSRSVFWTTKGLCFLTGYSKVI